ncbi:hypothetical protein H9P43_009949 [Blastocladiella emersonii ATCC 22665]|nr:hypothetical protein H9P43_009949 [Blastocladiella emersonii ATCC 22665]
MQSSPRNTATTSTGPSPLRRAASTASPSSSASRDAASSAGSAKHLAKAMVTLGEAVYADAEAALRATHLLGVKSGTGMMQIQTKLGEIDRGVARAADTIDDVQAVLDGVQRSGHLRRAVRALHEATENCHRVLASSTT